MTDATILRDRFSEEWLMRARMIWAWQTPRQQAVDRELRKGVTDDALAAGMRHFVVGAGS